MGKYDDALWNIDAEHDSSVEPMIFKSRKNRPSTLNEPLNSVFGELASKSNGTRYSQTEPSYGNSWKSRVAYKSDFLDILSRKGNGESQGGHMEQKDIHKDLLDLNHLSSQSVKNSPEEIGRDTSSAESNLNFLSQPYDSSQGPTMEQTGSQTKDDRNLQDFPSSLLVSAEEEEIGDSEGEMEILILSSEASCVALSHSHPSHQRATQDEHKDTGSQIAFNNNSISQGNSDTQISNINFQSEDLSISCDDSEMLNSYSDSARLSQGFDAEREALSSSTEINATDVQSNAQVTAAKHIDTIVHSTENQEALPSKSKPLLRNTNDFNEPKNIFNSNNMNVDIESNKENVVHGNVITSSHHISSPNKNGKSSLKPIFTSLPKKRTAELSDLCSRTNSASYRLKVGLSKRKRIDPLHGYLKR